jgi:predicted hydrocarbon binding protein
MALNTFYDKFIVTNNLKYKQHNFFLMNMPFLICPAEVLTGLIETHDPEFERKLYLAVRRSVANHLIPAFKVDFRYRGERLAKFLEHYFVASGWGSISNVDFDLEGKKAIVQVSNNPLASRLHGKAESPRDHILRGVLAGIFSSVFQEPVHCVETHCVALGEADCEFIIKKPNEFDYSDKRVRTQLEVEI